MLRKENYMAKNNSSTIGKGLGIAALAAAAAGAYYFYGSKKAAQHRKGLKGWAVKAQGDVMEKMEQAKDLTKEGYNRIVEEVLKSYKNVKNIAPLELATLGKELKSHWNAISSDIKKLSTKTPAKSKAKK